MVRLVEQPHKHIEPDPDMIVAPIRQERHDNWR
jgi:hypothetical protein